MAGDIRHQSSAGGDMETFWGDFVSGEVIQSQWGDDANASLDDRVSKSDTTTQTVVSDMTFSGSATFSNATPIKTNVVAERTSDLGVTIDGMLIKDGEIQYQSIVMSLNEWAIAIGTGTSLQNYSATTVLETYHIYQGSDKGSLNAVAMKSSLVVPANTNRMKLRLRVKHLNDNTANGGRIYYSKNGVAWVGWHDETGGLYQGALGITTSYAFFDTDPVTVAVGDYVRWKLDTPQSNFHTYHVNYLEVVFYKV